MKTPELILPIQLCVNINHMNIPFWDLYKNNSGILCAYESKK